MLTEKVESAQRAVDWIVEKHNTIEPVTFGNKAEDDFFHGLTSESSRHLAKDDTATKDNAVIQVDDADEDVTPLKRQIFFRLLEMSVSSSETVLRTEVLIIREVESLPHQKKRLENDTQAVRDIIRVKLKDSISTINRFSETLCQGMSPLLYLLCSCFLL